MEMRESRNFLLLIIGLDSYENKGFLQAQFWFFFYYSLECEYFYFIS